MTEGRAGERAVPSWGALGSALREPWPTQPPPTPPPTQPVNAGPKSLLSSIFPPGKTSPPHSPAERSNVVVGCECVLANTKVKVLVAQCI